MEPAIVAKEALTPQKDSSISSVNQKRESECETCVETNIGQRKGCNCNCLSKCCLLQGTQLPLYCFSKMDKVLGCSSEKNESGLSFLDILFKEVMNLCALDVDIVATDTHLFLVSLVQWEDRKVKGLFHHDITACHSKVLSGENSFIVHLIEGRDLKKRPTEFRIDKVLQPFDGKKFNFTKIGQEEVLFRFENSENGDKAQYFSSAPISPSDSPNAIAINVSPIGYGHVLLVPRILDCLPQRIDHQSFLLAVYMAKEAGNPFFRMGYNSLGGFATVNHLHFQGYYLKEPFPVEKAVIQMVTTLGSGIRICELVNYPVRGLVFEGGSSLQELSDTASNACIFLQDSEKPYNVLISDSGKRIFLLPQCYAERRVRGEVSQEMLETQLNPAVWELSGHMVLKRVKDYEEATEEKISRFLAETTLSPTLFEELKECILKILSHKSDVGDVESGHVDGTTQE